MSDLQQLLDMGFPENRAKRALQKTSNGGVQVAMDWIFAHDQDPDIDDPVQDAPAAHALGTAASSSAAASAGVAAAPAGTADDTSAKSLTCQECGKKLRTSTDVQLHAAKSGHTNFAESTEEIKPLTAEEKAAKIEALRERMREKRAAETQETRAEQIAKEKMRRMQGKDVQEARRQHEMEEMRKAAEQKKREKAEELAARNRARKLIEDDKKRRREDAEAAKAARLGQTATPTATAAAAATTTGQSASESVATVAAPAKEYTESRLQIRQPDGPPLVHTFPVSTTIGDLYTFLHQHRSSSPATVSLALSTTFPRRVFSSDADLTLTLTQAQLVPSAALVLTTKPLPQ